MNTIDIKFYFTIAALVLTAIFIATVVLKIRKGIKNGAYLQPISLLTVLLSSVTAFVLMAVASDLLFGSFEGKTMADLIEYVESNFGIAIEGSAEEILLNLSPDALAYILAIPIAILSPIIFLVLYLVANGIFSIVFKIVKRVLSIPKRVDTVGKTIGGVLGALEAIVVLIVFYIPLTALLNMSMPIISSMDIEDDTFTQISEGAKELSDSPVMKLVNYAGGDFLTTELTNIGSMHNKINVRDELTCIVDLVKDIVEFSSRADGASAEELTRESEWLIASVLTAIDRSEYISLIVSDSVHIVSGIVFDKVPETSKDPLDKLLISIRTFLDTGSRDTISEDLSTIKELIVHVADTDLFSAISSESKDAIKDVFVAKGSGENTLIKNAINTLKSNPRTTGIIAALNEYSVSIMYENIGGEVMEDSAVVYEQVKEGLNDLISIPDDLPEEEYKESVKETLSTTLTNNNINVEDDILEDMTTKVTEYLKENDTIAEDATEITDEQVTEILLKYYDAYLEYKDKSGTEGDGEGSGEGDGEGTFPGFETDGDGNIIIPGLGDGDGDIVIPGLGGEGDGDSTLPGFETDGDGNIIIPGLGEGEGDIVIPGLGDGDGDIVIPGLGGEGDGDIVIPGLGGEGDGDGTLPGFETDGDGNIIIPGLGEGDGDIVIPDMGDGLNP